MKENNYCDIIQDLLPNYIEGITSDESNKFISNHLNTCTNCKKELNNMNTLIKVNTVKEKKIDYLKLIHKKCKNILFSCILISLITFIISIFNSEPNINEAFFTLILFFMIIIGISIKYLFPLFALIISIFIYRKTRKKIFIFTSIICISMFFYSIISTINNILIYGF